MAQMNPYTAATLEAVNKLTTTEFATALQNGVMAGREYAANTPEGHWFPCGFAQLSIKLRKNDKRSATLEANGFRWDDYYKEWYLYGGTFTNSQSMDYKEAILDKVADVLKTAGIPCTVRSRMD